MLLILSIVDLFNEMMKNTIQCNVQHLSHSSNYIFDENYVLNACTAQPLQNMENSRKVHCMDFFPKLKTVTREYQNTCFIN